MDINGVLEHLVSFGRKLNELSEELGTPQHCETDIEKVRNMYVDEFYGKEYSKEERYFLSMAQLFDHVRPCLGEKYYFVDESALDEGDGTETDFWDVYLAKRIVSEQREPLEKGIYEEQIVRAQVLTMDGPFDLEYMDDKDRKIGSILKKIKGAYDTIEAHLARGE